MARCSCSSNIRLASPDFDTSVAKRADSLPEGFAKIANDARTMRERSAKRSEIW
jgi:hypothetical protein